MENNPRTETRKTTENSHVQLGASSECSVADVPRKILASSCPEFTMSSNFRESGKSSDITCAKHSTTTRVSQKTSSPLKSHPRQCSSVVSVHSPRRDRTIQKKSVGTAPIITRSPIDHSTAFNEQRGDIFLFHPRSSSTSNTARAQKLRSILIMNSGKDVSEDNDRSKNCETHNESSRSAFRGVFNSEAPSTSRATKPPSERNATESKRSSNGRDLDTYAGSNCSDSDAGSSVDWTTSGRNRVELIAGTSVYVDRAELRDMKDRWLKKPKELVRWLLKHMIGKKKLLKMTRTGSRNREAIPRTILRVIKKFMRKEVPRQLVLSTFDYNECITKFCDNLRQSEKKR
ncbi:uncharacterized protein LOC107044021 [Diachasma alloeum]|uniref:uncharacterized protein LOC107044021 n=1 Tax=Diachasma alloeum TaxID=454923 RepID=UPI0007383CC9|nr:uncharacterized protein LOC107044021 [Diachasma alloeum]